MNSCLQQTKVINCLLLHKQITLQGISAALALSVHSGKVIPLFTILAAPKLSSLCLQTLYLASSIIICSAILHVYITNLWTQTEKYGKCEGTNHSCDSARNTIYIKWRNTIFIAPWENISEKNIKATPLSCLLELMDTV